MWNGGPVPYGFRSDPDPRTIAIYPDADEAGIVERMFQVYVETRSDFKVRDYLQSHQIPARSGKATWTVSTIRKVLTNRRYIAEVEINRENKGIPDLPEAHVYRVAQAPYEPLISTELFEMAQAIRKERGAASPNRRGRPRSYSQTQCERVYLLQGIFVCGCCGHSMTPYYTKKRAGNHLGKKRKVDSFCYAYTCAQQVKNWKNCDHRNYIRAATAENWLVDTIKDFVTTTGVIEKAMEIALNQAQSDVRPSQEALSRTRKALQDNQEQIDTMIATISGGEAHGALLGFLNDRATQLGMERERLMAEQRRLLRFLAPLDEHFNAAGLRAIMENFTELAREAEPAEMQRLLRLTVRKMERMQDGTHWVEFYSMSKSRLPNAKSGRQWFETNVSYDSP